MLVIKDLVVQYGLIRALRGISLQVKQGDIVTLVGANGAGKSSTLRAISALEKVQSGTISFMEKEIQGASSKTIVEQGCIQVPEGRRIFPNMTVEENLMLGAYLRKDKHEVRKDIQEVFMKFPRLQERYHQLAGTLSGGEQQMLAISRALMARPKLLLLDEPSMGLAPLLVKEIFDIIVSINKQGTTILLVEQNAKMALSIADYAYVMETGTIVLEGTGQELLQSEEVQKVYLGG